MNRHRSGEFSGASVVPPMTMRAFVVWLSGAVTAIGIIVAALNSIWIRPLARDEAIAVVREHTVEAEKAMSRERPNLVTRAEWDRWTAEKDERWRNLDVRLAEIKAELAKVQENQLEILRRMAK